MEKIVEQGLLYDFYGKLLTEHQRQVYESVVFDNMSLAEIAAEQGISRQGVHDIIKRCDKILLEYEEKLQLLGRFLEIRENIDKIDKMLDDISTVEQDNRLYKQITELRSITESIQKVL